MNEHTIPVLESDLRGLLTRLAHLESAQIALTHPEPQDAQHRTKNAPTSLPFHQQRVIARHRRSRR